jgi:hypothetical protein
VSIACSVAAKRVAALGCEVERISEPLAVLPATRFFYGYLATLRTLAMNAPRNTRFRLLPDHSGHPGFLLILLTGSPGRSSGHAAAYQTRSAASKGLTFKNNGPLRAAPDVLDRDAMRFDPARLAWSKSGCTRR